MLTEKLILKDSYTHNILFEELHDYFHCSYIVAYQGKLRKSTIYMHYNRLR